MHAFDVILKLKVDMLQPFAQDVASVLLQFVCQNGIPKGLTALISNAARRIGSSDCVTCWWGQRSFRDLLWALENVEFIRVSSVTCPMEERMKFKMCFSPFWAESFTISSQLLLPTCLFSTWENVQLGQPRNDWLAAPVEGFLPKSCWLTLSKECANLGRSNLSECN